MSIFAEFRIRSSALAFYETFEAVPDVVIEIERVVASEDVLTPYFWVSEVPLAEFETAVSDDPSVENLRQVDSFEDTGLYRAEWVDDVQLMTEALLDFASVILSASGTSERWEITTRFEDSDHLSEFQSFCRDNDIEVTVQRLFELSQPLTGRRYGLTEKQEEALMAAWEAGYFESPRRTTLTEVAADLGITQQSLSNRLRRGHQALVANTLTIQGPQGA